MYNSNIPWGLPSRHMNVSTNKVELELSFPNLLKVASEKDENGFVQLMSRLGNAIYDMGVWFGVRKNYDKLMSTFHRTPLMLAASSGNLDVLKFILSVSDSNVNEISWADKTTALHCAASSGSHNAIKVVETLLNNGAYPTLVDSQGRLPIDVVFMPDQLEWSKLVIINILKVESEKKEHHGIYPPAFPDINSDILSSDGRMFAYNIYPCAKAGSHDHIECPFYHSSEFERRRNPREFRYSSDPCVDFKNGRQCHSGDGCLFAHGFYEKWLHPERFRTEFCQNRELCKRKVCFFAHTQQELRSRYAAAMSAIPPPAVRAVPGVIPTHLDRPSSSVVRL